MRNLKKYFPVINSSNTILKYQYQKLIFQELCSIDIGKSSVNIWMIIKYKKNKMIIRRNLAYFNSDAREIIQSNQQLSQSEDLSHYINFPVNTLNPQTPITSRLMEENSKHGSLLKMEKQDSEFSFKQKNDFLIEEKPLNFDALDESREKAVFFIKNFETRNEKIPTNETIKSTIERPHLIDPFPIYQQAKQKVKSEQPIEKERKAIGKFIKIRQSSNNASLSIDRLRSQSELLQEPKITRGHYNSGTKSKLNETLNKIKSLNISTKAEEERGASIIGNKLRYSTAKISDQPKFSDSRVQESSTLGDNFYPIKKQVITSIKRHVQKMNGSIAKEPRRVIPHEEQEYNSPLMLFKKDHAFEQSSSRQASQNIQPKSKSFIISKTNKKSQNSNFDEPIIISYKTTLLQLKQLSTQFSAAMKIKVKIPEIFSSPLFQQEDDQHQLFMKAGFIIKELQIESSSLMTIRKYSNCVIVLIDVIAILSYFSGHVYFGGWVSGSKQGLGFEWLPGKFVYYGEYSRNKREGYGVFKNRQGQTLLGKWKGNRFLQTL